METCKECLHLAVCGIYSATGGNVRSCKHFIPNKTGRWIIHKDYCECSECHVCGSPRWKRCPVCEAIMEVTDER